MGDECEMNIDEEKIQILRSKLSPAKRILLEKRLRGEVESDAKLNVIARLSDTTPPPLSFGQQRLWFLQQLEPDNPFYNEHLAVQLTGTLNVVALEQSVNQIVQRHEVLRTTFKVLDGQPVQIIAPQLTLAIPLVDLSELSEAEQQKEAYRLATEQNQRPFDLVQGPLLRWTLLRLSQDNHVLLFTIHHTVYDTWSLGVIIRELSDLYQAFLTGKSSSLPELPIQYADFAVWQRQELQGENLKSQLAYWKRQLANAPPLLQLPTDHPRPAVPTYRGAGQSFQLSKHLTQALKALSHKAEATLFMTLLAAFKVLLYRYAGQTDIVVGSPIANRTQAEVEGLIGFFVNTLVLRTDLAGNPTFEELLGRIREGTIGAYANQDLPFEKLVEELQPERSINHNPLFQVSFALQNIPQAQRFELPELTLTPFLVESTRAVLDLRLDMVETDAGLEGSWEYNTDLFDASRISRIRGHFPTLLAEIAANPQQRIEQLPLLTEAEEHQLGVQWNQTQMDYPQAVCIHELFEAQAEKTPDAVAVGFEKQQLTYRELNQRANQLAHALKKLDVKAEILVGICVERSLAMVVGLLGILKAGGAYVPLDPAYPPERLAWVLSDSQAPILLTQQHLVDKLPQHQARVLCLDTDWETIPLNTDNLSSRATPDNLAYVIYTSGSTGKPKGVQITHSSVVNFLTSMATQPGLTTQDTLLAVTSISFDIAALELYLPLMKGARLELARREVAMDGRQLGARLHESGITVMQATPATWRMLLAAGWQGHSHLKVLCGGEALPRDLAEALLNKCGALWNMYGPTETTIWSTVCKVAANRLSRAIVPIGRPIANTQIYLLDVGGQSVSVGIPGELHIGGAGLARGYLNRPQLTAAKFITHASGARLYKSGDLACYLPDGQIEYIERLDHQVKIRGFRIELGEIETVLNQLSLVRQAVVVAREDEPGNKRLVAYIVGQTAAEVPTHELRSLLEKKLPNYMVPSAFMVLEALPLTPNGKIDRRALPIPEIPKSFSEKAVAQPRNSVESRLSEIWVEALSLEQIGVYDNFFELGGHSLLATQIVSRIEKTLEVALPLRLMFESPTVAGLAEAIQDAKKIESGQKLPTIERTSRNTNLPLSFSQSRLWFLHQLNVDKFAYNLPAAVSLVGSLNIVALEQSFNEIVRRHEVFRTTFPVIEGQPVQQISSSLKIGLPVLDLCELPKTEQKQEVQGLVKEWGQRVFDLAQDPLLRVALLKLDEQKYLLMFNIHHIIADGWSMGILVRELAALYSSFSQGQPSLLPELPIQYADFAVWQRQWLQGEILETQLAYWKQQLGTNPSVLELPTDREPALVATACGTRKFFALSPMLTVGLNTLSKQEGVTLFMILLGAFNTLLHSYKGQEDILVGSPIANRNRSETEGLIGCFVNTLVLRSNLSGNPSFREYLGHIREITLGAYAHQDLPFEKLISELGIERNLNSYPLFRVWFVLQNSPMPDLEVSELTLNTLEFETGVVRYDLKLDLVETSESLQGFFEYKTDLFKTSTIARMVELFKLVLSTVIQQPDIQLNALSAVLKEAQKQQQLAQQKEFLTSRRQKLGKLGRRATSELSS
ncbi:MAG: amino acid adenylation domain-containing protein [Leptolyngbya sp. SIO1E4]|nr:amino acid adenylation domain-containing protein [Leptolyngbya sp. SIO1E4]